MQILWDLKSAVVKDIMKRIPEPNQPYSTISSIVRILERKGYVGFKAYGKTHVYHPLVSKEDYRKQKFKSLFTGYFDSSIESMVSFLVKEEKIKPEELEELIRMINEKSDKP